MKKLEQLGISPTPWTINEDGEVLCKYIRNAIQPNEIRARVVARPNFYFDESKSDAHLIAAAPDLYEALSGLLEIVCVDCRSPYEIDGKCVKCPRVVEAEAALAKASGESEASK